METDQPEKKQAPHLRRMLVAGILTVIPLWITWFVLKLVFVTLSEIGEPTVVAAAHALRDRAPAVSHWLLLPWVEDLFSVLLTLLALYLLGLGATFVIGKRIIRLFEEIITRIPFVQTVYGSTKTLIESLRQDPEKLQRVVMIEFPSSEMKTIGFVTAMIKDAATDEELAAVYVPTTPNPTSGYLEIVPTKKLIATDMSIEEAMRFIISGGTVSPESVAYSKSKPPIDSTE